MKLILIGFATSGKTTVGKLLADKLALDFVDVDEVIEQRGTSIKQLFEQGEQTFRKVENDVLDSLTESADVVIACGGGSVTCGNFEKLKQNATVIWLNVSPQKVIERLGDVERPLFDGKNINELQQLVDERNELYRKYSDITMYIDNLTPEQITQKIICG